MTTRGCALLLAFVLLAPLGCSHDSLDYPQLLDTTPFGSQIEGEIATNRQLDAVEVGQPVILRFTLSGYVTFTWRLTTPAGSVAVLDDPSAAEPSFTPDVAGAYLVEVDASNGAMFRQATRRLTAASFIGEVVCLNCHIARGQQTAMTLHSSAMVDCEVCHGPGGLHQSDPRNIGVTLRAELCGPCHEGSPAGNQYEPWQQSAHGSSVPAAALGDPSCVRCHTARGFLYSISGMAPPAPNDAASNISCAACHDPHRAANPFQLRLVGAVPLASGAADNVGRAAACVTCHQGDVTDPVAQANAGGDFPCAVQADMMATRGAIRYGQAYGRSFHSTTVFRLRPFTGDPADSDTPDSCVICHMAASADPALGDHSVNLRDGPVMLVAGNCDRCHPGLDTFDWQIGEDFDGDGVKRGVQTEVHGLVQILFQAIRGADANNVVTRPGGNSTPAFYPADLSLTTPELRQAIYNYNFVVVDGSFGIHNTTYTVQLLQRTYSELTGTPFGTAFPSAAVR